MALTIGVDVGGTKVAAGVVDDDGSVLQRVLHPTPSSDPRAVADTIAAAVDGLRHGYHVEAVGIGAAGFVDTGRSVVLFAPNLAWRDERLRDEVQQRVALPVVVENDANAMAWGEYRFGAGEKEPFLVAVTLGTGVGGGIVLDGRLYRGRHGFGGEPGHMQVVPGGRPCGCGNIGCWEQYCSGSGLVHTARELVLADPDRGARMLDLADGSVGKIDGYVVHRAADEGDEAALACFADVARWLGQGLADLSAVLDPGCFVIGGGLADAGDLILPGAQHAFDNALTARGHRPKPAIRLASLGPEAGLIGAADLARQPA